MTSWRQMFGRENWQSLSVSMDQVRVAKTTPKVAAAVGGPERRDRFIVIGDLISLVAFSGLVTTALCWRRHRDWHRRLMVVASIMIVGPAIARLERVGLAVPVPAVLLGLLVTLGVYDALQLGRLHRATVVSASVVLVSLGALLTVLGTRAAEILIASMSP